MLFMSPTKQRFNANDLANGNINFWLILVPQSIVEDRRS